MNQRALSESVNCAARCSAAHDALETERLERRIVQIIVAGIVSRQRDPGSAKSTRDALENEVRYTRRERLRKRVQCCEVRRHGARGAVQRKRRGHVQRTW